MKTGLIVIGLALLPLAAQDNSGVEHMVVGTRAGNPTIPAIRLAAKDLEQSAGIVYLKGNVEINLPTHTLFADEAEYDQDSGEIEARGNVRLKPANPDARGASQFGTK
jgi:lipopolysaccharide assembly outer membrane protein LptD (OstA)